MRDLPTEYGTATLWWDSDSNPADPGWVLRYHLAPADSPDALGRRHLDEPLDADLGEDDEVDARRAALELLGRYRVGAGGRLTSSQAAQLTGLASGASWRATSWRPDADGYYEGRVAWWWESTIIAAMASRPGRGYRSDLA